MFPCSLWNSSSLHSGSYKWGRHVSMSYIEQLLTRQWILRVRSACFHVLLGTAAHYTVDPTSEVGICPCSIWNSNSLQSGSYKWGRHVSMSYVDQQRPTQWTQLPWQSPGRSPSNEVYLIIITDATVVWGIGPVDRLLASRSHVRSRKWIITRSV